mmetsp:Transcript_28801/g.96618  ORF Transcript_28801/g.96618 Transcript_28801/m.96618 type:complete len:210 (-) Transcript_28801:22-651(-)
MDRFWYCSLRASESWPLHHRSTFAPLSPRVRRAHIVAPRHRPLPNGARRIIGRKQPEHGLAGRREETGELVHRREAVQQRPVAAPRARRRSGCARRGLLAPEEEEVAVEGERAADRRHILRALRRRPAPRAEEARVHLHQQRRPRRRPVGERAKGRAERRPLAPVEVHHYKGVSPPLRTALLEGGVEVRVERDTRHLPRPPRLHPQPLP